MPPPPPPPPARCLRTQSPSAMEGGREGAWHGSSQALRTNTSLPPSFPPSVCLSWTDEHAYLSRGGEDGRGRRLSPISRPAFSTTTVEEISSELQVINSCNLAKPFLDFELWSGRLARHIIRTLIKPRPRSDRHTRGGLRGAGARGWLCWQK